MEPHRRVSGVPSAPADTVSAATHSVELPAELYRELRRLALVHERSVDELIRHAVEIHFSDVAVAARHRLVDRLARLEAGLGDSERLHDQIAASSRSLRAR